MISFDRINEIKQKLHFEGVLSSPINKVWLLWRHGFCLNHLVTTDQLMHVEVPLQENRKIFAENICVFFRKNKSADFFGEKYYFCKNISAKKSAKIIYGFICGNISTEVFAENNP